jgi:hypothetical protein
MKYCLISLVPHEILQRPVQGICRVSSEERLHSGAQPNSRRFLLAFSTAMICTYPYIFVITHLDCIFPSVFGSVHGDVAQTSWRAFMTLSRSLYSLQTRKRLCICRKRGNLRSSVLRKRKSAKGCASPITLVSGARWITRKEFEEIRGIKRNFETR